MFPLLSVWSDWGILILRVCLGIILVAHGWPKLRRLGETGKHFHALGFHPGSFWGTVVAVVEFFGGLAFILGFYAQIAALFVGLQFLVINVWKISKSQALVGGWEFDLLILGAAVLLLVIGSGALSLDHFFYLGTF